MLTNVTSLTGNGLKDWLLQRVSAIYLLVYSLLVFGFFVTHSPVHYDEWTLWCHSWWMQIATMFALLSLLVHAWIGLWTVTTDYISSTAVRLLVQFLIFSVLIGELFWGLMMVWGSLS